MSQSYGATYLPDQKNYGITGVPEPNLWSWDTQRGKPKKRIAPLKYESACQLFPNTFLGRFYINIKNCIGFRSIK